MKNWEALNTDDRERILNAVDTLLEKNPELPDQLTRLARLKEKKPFVWTIAVKKLCAES